MADGTEQDHTGTTDELLRKLAAVRGVSTSFRGWDGKEHPVAASTLHSVLAALGDRTGTPEELQDALREAELAPWRRLLPPSVVSREGREIHVAVHVPHGTPVRVWAVTEDGNRVEAGQRDNWEDPRDVDGTLTGRASFAIPGDLPLGWHTLHADAAGELAECALVITPERLETTRRLASERHWGLTAQLYSVRSSRSWGIGDFSDLLDLAAIAGEDGAGFVLVNPLHAGEPRPPIEDSPYLPTTRRFFNPLYIRVEDVPEYGYLDPAARAGIEKNAALLHSANTAVGLLERNVSYQAKLEALELIFKVRRSPGRARMFENFCVAEGKGIDDFALWCTLAERLPPTAPEWSGEALSPDTPYCDNVRHEQADRLEFYRWLQWICDEQLATAQRTAKQCGMAIGIVHDLAVGVKTTGADAWMLRGVLAQGVTVGAPPDVFNQQGQNWTQPPWHPGRLAAAGYKPYRDMLRTVLRHAGGIRVDHILGLFRLWWIPEGAGPDEGTYVYYDHEALIGILALEAQRAGATVVGEDLGVFEPWVRDYLTERGILGTSILWFEHNEAGPLPPEKYRQQCLTSVNTHDLPPTAGYLAGEHVTLRETLGLLLRPVEEERAEAAAEQEAVLALVRERGLLADSSADVQRTVEALYALTALTPSALLGVALVDAVGETRTQNQPGTDAEHPNWRIPLAGPGGPVLIDDLADNARFNSLVGVVRNALKPSG
ncbi:4-alpha-glucanotransferase [Arthrobacter sp. PvP102]|uniref:4-alpha-glucanotransferase n=1 Tax=unclassified Arthrobacter TaxID=235627 RepID=UPI001AE7FCC2|nr:MULTISPECIES: 4-alpha-glucanotransferase [unclassified Arthrobacter]MBP1231449.1 4-alpha-glucanotransferase [Arthrobacter sp. PvP103]MBP1236584.1 4-alpha-glucanotransferase [Arthrobacter sp. PvP102]